MLCIDFIHLRNKNVLPCICRTAFFVTLFMYVPQIVAAFTVLGVSSGSADCEKPLYIWVIFAALRMCVALAINGHIFTRYRAGDLLVVERLRILQVYVHGGAFPLYIVGSMWIFHEHTCKHENSALYNMAFSMLVIGLIFHLIPFLVALFLGLTLCLCAPCVMYCFSRRLRTQEPVGIRQTDLNNLPKVKYRRGLFSDRVDAGVTVDSRGSGSPAPDDLVGDGAVAFAASESEEQCSICLSNYDTGEDLRVLPDCRHHFHAACVDEWLIKNASCPNCRQSLLPPSQRLRGTGAGASADANAGGSANLPASGSSTTVSPIGSTGARRSVVALLGRDAAALQRRERSTSSWLPRFLRSSASIRADQTTAGSDIAVIDHTSSSEVRAGGAVGGVAEGVELNNV
jgi:hypothetical protein